MIEVPPQYMIDIAVMTANKSPCAKSKRGVVIYRDRDLDGEHVTTFGVGFNGPPGDIACAANSSCARDCGKRCVHAEMRALREIPRNAEMVRFAVLLHVKTEYGKLVAGGGPSCWQCSREILDVGLIHGVWLYQTGRSITGRDGEPDRWRYWEAIDFHRETCMSTGVL